jgi:predicted DNA-binding protein YlxM (UPF0122 family)
LTVSIKEITHYIDTQIKKSPQTCQRINVTNIANHFRVNRQWLTILFKRNLKISSKEYIRRKKFERFHRICTKPGWESFTKLLPKMGVGSIRNFSRLVFRMSGYSPKKRYWQYKRVTVFTGEYVPYPTKKYRKFSSQTREEIIRQFLKTGHSLSSVLNEREEKIVRLYYRLDKSKPMTLSEIGQLHQLTRERVRQIIIESVHKIYGAVHKRKRH